MPTAIPPITHGSFYHIYNRGNNRENIFFQECNYGYFLELWWKHLSPIAETWSYCLLRNHFHAVVFIKNREDLTGLKVDTPHLHARLDNRVITSDSRGDLSGLKPPHQYFSNFFNAYARGVNVSMQRTGALFERPFKRIPVGSISYLMRLIVYIHQNPQKHHFTPDFWKWNYSSYHELSSERATCLARERVIQLFGSREDFVRIHQEIQPFEGFEGED